MEQLKRIMVVFDESHDTQTALLRAIELCRVTPAEIHIVSTLYSTLNFINGEILVETEELLRERLMERREREIEHVLEKLDVDTLNITHEVLWTPVAHAEISHLCKADGYDLLIKTASRHLRLEGFIHTPLDWHLLRECPCPVLIVTEEKWPKGSTILAAIDAISGEPEHMALNGRIIEHATYMGDLLDDEVHAATACPPLPVLVDLEYTTIDPHVYLEQMKATALARSKEAIKDTFLPGDNMHVVVGSPELALAELAEKLNSRMIVMGTVSRSGLKGYIMGNTAEQILYNMNCDILAIKPDNFSVD
jgi:universal stress protein E